MGKCGRPVNRTIAALLEVAQRKGIQASFPADVISQEFVELSHEDKTLIVHKTRTPFLSSVSAKLVTDKYLSGRLMARAGLPVAPKRLSFDLAEPDEVFLLEQGELVVKPNRADRGVGVTLRVQDRPGLRAAFGRAQSHGSGVLLERFVRGREYRVLVIQDRAVAVLEWQPSGKIQADGIPGGEIAIDRTEEAYGEYLDLAVRAAQLFGIDVAGIDLICPDISQPSVVGEELSILEVNPGPDFLWHMQPHQGQGRPVMDLFLDFLFPSVSGNSGGDGQPKG